MLKNEGTRLSTIHSHVLWLHCACGHTASMRVQDLLAMKPPPKTIGDVMAKARCKNCSQLNASSCQIETLGQAS